MLTWTFNQITVNDLPVGRSVDEALRLIDAFQFTEKYGEVCPANWHAGQEGMKATSSGYKSYIQKNPGGDVTMTNGSAPSINTKPITNSH
jgi:peroxiredoxin 2/4